jgi:hypothetical protein
VSGACGPVDSADTIGCVTVLALIAGTVSYLHMHALVALHGQPGWVAVLMPLSVDGMIVAASTTLLAESRSGGRGGVLPWALLVIGSIASLAANVAVAEPTLTGRVIAAWPSFALIGSYELLMRQVRRAASRDLGRAVKSAQRGRAGHRRHAVSCPAAEAVGQARAESGCAAASVAVGGGEPGYGRFAAEREGDRGPVRPA